MLHKILLLIAFITIFLSLIFSPKASKAEIATVRDWIGFFPAGTSNTSTCGITGTTSCDSKAGAFRNTWAYTNSCTQTPGATPRLADPTGCSFTLTPPPTSGSFEFRMYANNQETPDALIATSKTITATAGPTPTPTPTVNKLYYITGDLIINSNITINETGIIFVGGNFTIDTNLTHTGSNAGLVFIVKGDVVISPSVTRIDAVIMSSGRIYDAGSGCSHSLPVSASQLVINGSLISLDNNNKIEFCRSLGANNTTTPAEKINQQPKYLVILRDLYSDTLQKWSEIQ